ncbi:MAG: protein-L-isoaspartate(D-aspartate) O-methyltransferase [Anaerolineaceae bacterium]|nr:protein-L-isoaspartate(D-aspartate) O-methyltransferase [Anaerolineaceae bacterium]MCB9100508.1 protein-L-isoaspartate(D-aspartate) O-methyltransferase [Anaerolineales bacterium]
MFGKPPNLEEARELMVAEQLVKRHISDPRVLAAMRTLPRHRFIEEKLWRSAYRDKPLPIGHGQTISQPYMVAFMTEALHLPDDRPTTVLEIGTGSGYQAAILSQLVDQVYSIERIEFLAERVKQLLPALGITNVDIKVGDGGYGWPEHAPYDGIVVTAAAPQIPAPLIAQLKDGAYLVVPVGPKQNQYLMRLQRQGDQIVEENLVPVAFVPLLGEHGWER